ncbi:hypothetical protein IFM89_006177 [Coptis chinensis]|uniref:Uncharacterized protein n=1 Tax=Coptis chinensis TaxID=261450 RepID=A0A835GZC2_9MAGN|nr:hypothetical protein IFM89_006177 [Coptis chinensis]
MSITSVMKQGCFKAEKKNRKQQHPQVKKMAKLKKITLQEWLVASPSHFKHERITSGSRAELMASSLHRSESGKSRKKVSFRMPEEADTILFYSPEFGKDTLLVS